MSLEGIPTIKAELGRKFRDETEVIDGRGAFIVIPPLIFIDGDFPEVYIREIESGLEISDDGATISALESVGIGLSGRIAQIFTVLASSFGVIYEPETKSISKRVPREGNIASAIIDIIQVLLILNSQGIIPSLVEST